MAGRWLIAISVSLLCGGCAEPEQVSSTEQNSINFKPTVLSLLPVAYWRLGEPGGTTLVDSSPNGFTGTYSGTVGFKTPGSVNGDSDYAVTFDPTVRTGYGNIPDNHRLSLTQAWDDFDRTGTLGWGTSGGGDAWIPEVSGPGYFSTDGNVALINPNGNSGTFQIGIPAVSQLNGDVQIRASWTVQAAGGMLEPITIVARRVDNNNFIRAALEELSDTTLQLSIYKTTNGVTSPLVHKPLLNGDGGHITYKLGDWYYVRFQFNDGTLRAKAWIRDAAHTGDPDPTGYCAANPCRISYEPSTWLANAVDSAPVEGTVAIRSANSLGKSRPLVQFDAFWLETVGFTIHYVARAAALEWPGGADTDVLGKGSSHGNTHQAEYEARFTVGDSSDPCKACLKFYVFNLAGGLGAAAEYPGPDKGSIASHTWYDIVAELDPGDYLDLDAGVTMYVNGSLWVDPSMRCTPAESDGGMMYSGVGCTPGTTNPEWQIVPQSGTQSLKIGTFDTAEHWNGDIDEVAVFDRKLNATDIANLYLAWHNP